MDHALDQPFCTMLGGPMIEIDKVAEVVRGADADSEVAIEHPLVNAGGGAAAAGQVPCRSHVRDTVSPRQNHHETPDGKGRMYVAVRVQVGGLDTGRDATLNLSAELRLNRPGKARAERHQ